MSEPWDLPSRLIANLSFPIFVAVWLMLRTDHLLRDVRDALRELNAHLRTLNARLG